MQVGRGRGLGSSKNNRIRFSLDRGFGAESDAALSLLLLVWEPK
ncbi:hypothetical protein predicted by Glimmer/Critica [Bdellovibrio bacteriovorus HD100]|uniref:Uncharacterized protein n=1 Tax=Bdellovibrio bacteriovorus (strain ATCC 15356 / DSM 50701 / NCIMB 9529 / HD100) TaxID=264462 RepID=Q6MN35_BDEBA|nr:hypothetical protein predicted by Glimmer/Critica [Bdellovibrio bacteriovorus HD100]